MRVRALTANAPEGKPLPASIADRLALQSEHWATLAELTEDRREASALEIFLPSVLKDLAKQPSGVDPARGSYVTAKDLLVALERPHSFKVNTAGLAAIMLRLGWLSARIAKDRRRVYIIPQSD